MKVFVSSRMSQFAERKAAINAIHVAGHRPLFIEAEEYRATPDELREKMDRMLEQADLFVGIYGDSLGENETALDYKPVLYELKTMAESLGEAATERMLLFAKKDQSPDSRSAVDVLAKVKGLNAPTIFERPHELTGVIFEEMCGFEPKEPEWREQSRIQVEVEVSAQDVPGLLGAISEYFYAEYGMNVDQVAGSSWTERAVLHLSLSLGEGGRSHRTGGGFPRPRNEGGSVPQKEFEERLRKDLAERCETSKRNIKVYATEAGPPREKGQGYFFVDLRTIDTPGQLNAVCKAVKETELSIADVHLTPSPMEFPRQTSLSMRIALDGDREVSMRRQFMELETRLRDLPGVMAIDTRFSRSLTGEAKSGAD